MADDYGWRRFLKRLSNVAQHMLIMIAVIVSLWGTAKVVEHLLPEKGWFRENLAFVEDRAMMGLVAVLFVGLIWEFLKDIGKD